MGRNLGDTRLAACLGMASGNPPRGPSSVQVPQRLATSCVCRVCQRGQVGAGQPSRFSSDTIAPISVALLT